jgi:hypothetical protein
LSEAEHVDTIKAIPDGDRRRRPLPSAAASVVYADQPKYKSGGHSLAKSE